MTISSSYLVLGATGTIGSCLSRLLVSEGHSVLLGGRDEKKLMALSDELNMPHHITDAAQFESVNQFVVDAQERYSSISGAVNCVGSILLKPAHLTSEQEWLSTLNTNLSSSFALLRATTKAMLKTGGSIVLVSAAIGEIGISNHEAISAAKAGVNGMTRAAAATYATNNIRVNCVAPGLVDTALTSRIIQNKAALESSLAMHPLGRVSMPKQIANAIYFLLQPENDGITGQVIGVDGGLSRLKTLTKPKSE